MTYRSDEEALRLHIGQLERELSGLERDQARLQDELRHEQALAERAAARLDEAGPGGGLHRSGRRDRIDVAVAVMVVVSLPLLYLHFEWHRYVVKDRTVIPAILMLGTPGLLGAILAYPYRWRGPRFILLFVAATLMAILPLVNLVLP